MSVAVRRTGAQDYSRYIKVLLAGQPGSGKTRLASTFPHPIYADAEGGLMSIADRNVPYVRITSSDDLLHLKYALDQTADVREKVLGVPIETVVIDTLDEVQRILIRERLEQTKKESLALQDWGWLGEQMAAIIRGFRNLENLHVVFTAHLKDSRDDESGRIWFEPGLQGQVGKQLPAYVDLALLLKTRSVASVEGDKAVKRDVRFLLSQSDPSHDWIKDRSGRLPPELPVDFETDYQRLAEAIYGHLDLAETEEISELSLPEEVVAPAEPQEAQIRRQAEPALTPADPEPKLDFVPNPKPAADAPTCVECGAVVSADQRDLSTIRFRKILCKDDFAAEKKKGR